MLALLAIAGGLFGYGLYRLPALELSEPQHRALVTFGAVGLFIASTMILGIGLLIDRNCFQALRALTRGTHIIGHSNAAHELELPRHHWLGDLPTQVLQLGEGLYRAQRDTAAATALGAQAESQQRTQLESILQGLSEGVVVCDANANVLLYNPAALEYCASDYFGLGRSLYGVLSQAPIESSLALLRSRREHESTERRLNARFVCPLENSDEWLYCRLSLLPASSSLHSGFVLAFSEAGRDLGNTANATLVDAPLRMRQNLANLRAAAETSMLLLPASESAQQRTFLQVVIDESSELSERLAVLLDAVQSNERWPLHDVLASDLFRLVKLRLEQRNGPPVEWLGDPLWIRVDAHSFSAALEFVLWRLSEITSADSTETVVHLECLLGDQRVYLDVRWHGEPLTASTLAEWESLPIDDLSDINVGAVLERHQSEWWSQAHRETGKAVLRIPVPLSTRQWQTPKILPDRPEFYDFSLNREIHYTAGDDIGTRSLSDLTYVVFDTETTGLEPSRGDEIVQIAGVRIINGRVLSGETFDQRVNPGRPIPRSSTRFHGITDEDVANAPSIKSALADFQSFVGGDTVVLVAHNAAFDMRFLQLKEASTGIVFANPVLDTLLISAYLHNHASDHNLDAIAARLGLAAVENRHNALGDALATAEVFLKLLPLMLASGLHTLADAVAAHEKMVALRKMQKRF